jgi:hypothetical protein
MVALISFQAFRKLTDFSGISVQVGAKTTEKFPTWREHPVYIAFCGISAVQVGAKSVE